MPDPLAALRANNIKYSIATGTTVFPIIEEVSLYLQSGEIVGVLGPNGCGKSTLLRIMGRLQEPTSGEVTYAASTTTLGMIFQHVQENLIPWRTVVDNVALPAILRGHDSTGAKDEAIKFLAGMGLETLGTRYPHEISGGQQQLIILARWAVNPPSILLVDEAWSMLDLVQRPRAAGILKQLAAVNQCAVCVVNHNVSELASVADRVLILTDRPSKIALERDLKRYDSTAKRIECLWEAAKKVSGTSSSA